MQLGKGKKTYSIYTCNLGLVLPHKVHGEKASRFGFPQKCPQDGSKPIEERGWKQEINKIKMSGEIL
jgi:hypothetical protein